MPRKKTRKGGPKKRAVPKKSSVHVRGPSDIKAFTELVKNMKIVVVIVTADWCGHCQRRKGEFQQLMNMSKAPHVGVAQVDEKQLSNIPTIANAKISGYPSAIMVGPKGMASFKGPDGTTNALPKSDTASLKEIISNGSNLIEDTADVEPTTENENENENENETENENENENENGNKTMNLKNLPSPPQIIPIKSVSSPPKSTSMFPSQSSPQFPPQSPPQSSPRSENMPPDDVLSDLVTSNTGQPRVGGARSLSLFKQLEQMVGKTTNITRKATKMGRKLSRRIKKIVRRFR